MELRQQLLSLQYACWGLLCMILYHAPNQRSLSLPYWGRGWMGQWQARSGPCGACESTQNVLVDCHIAPPCSQYTARQSMKNYFCFLVLLIFLRGAISALLQGTDHLLQSLDGRALRSRTLSGREAWRSAHATTAHPSR